MGFSADAIRASEPAESRPAAGADQDVAPASDPSNGAADAEEDVGERATIDETPTEETAAQELPAPATGARLPAQSGASGAESWRYRWRNGHWWYWLKSKHWAWWDGAAWRHYVAEDYARWHQEMRSARARVGISRAWAPYDFGSQMGSGAVPPALSPAPDSMPAYRYQTRGRFTVPQSRSWIVVPGYHPTPSMRSGSNGVFGSGRGVSGPGGGFDPPTSSGIGVY